MSSILIRKLAPTDRDEWEKLWGAYLAFYKTELPADVYASSFDRMISNEDHEFHGLVAEHDGNLVGLTHYLFHRHGWKVANVCYLQDLYVSETVRGSGVGRKLIEAVYIEADKADAPDVYWMTQNDNHAARLLYDRIANLTPFVKYAR